MTLVEAQGLVKYLTDAQGHKTDVVVPVAVWEALLRDWQCLMEQLEQQEDREIVQSWLQARSINQVETISLDDLEAELAIDGSVSG